jgi:hypothetical protein
MFELPMAEVSALCDASGSKDSAKTSFSVGGHCFGSSTDWQTSHRRIRHLPMGRLKHIAHHNLADGFTVRGGNKGLHCGCDSCRLAKNPSSAH